MRNENRLQSAHVIAEHGILQISLMSDFKRSFRRRLNYSGAGDCERRPAVWIPAFAGMTVEKCGNDGGEWRREIGNARRHAGGTPALPKDCNGGAISAHYVNAH